MLEKNFDELYLMFRANYYRQLVRKIGSREGSLSATESYCVELIHLLGKPTVSEFAAYLSISVPNANYKINSLVSKGYVTRRTSETDKREQQLCVTEKFLKYYGLNDYIIARLINRVKEKFNNGETEIFDTLLNRVNAIFKEIISNEKEIENV
jgi:DNA-binding MarR family transcriptional regulator